ncbi:MAG: DUF4397 domain-containing protein, partial [Pedobacter sp.]
LLTALAITLGLSSCMKDDVENTPISISGLSLVQASPTTEKLDVYIDNTRASIDDFVFGTKMDYLRAYSGDRTITVTKKGITTRLTSDVVKLVPDSGYTVFVVDKFDAIDLLTLRDDLASPAAGKAKIRFVNLSPDGGALNLAVNGVATDLVDNKAFKEFSAFLPVDAAESVTFNIKNKATGAVEATISGVKIENGKIYTIYAKGLKANADDLKFGAAIFTHK